MKQKRAQISIEYLIVIVFVTFVIISLLGIALYYSAEIKNSIKFNQLERFANKLTTSSESVFYAGMPSRATITAYLPEGIKNVSISGKDVIFEVSTSSGLTKISYTSNVVLEGTITPNSGVKRVKLTAEQDKVTVSES